MSCAVEVLLIPRVFPLEKLPITRSGWEGWPGFLAREAIGAIGCFAFFIHLLPLSGRC